MNRGDWIWVAGLGALGVGFWFWQNDVEGNGKAGSEKRSVPTFSEVDVSGSMRLEVVVGAEPSVELSGDENLLRLIETKVEGNRLSISATEDIDPDLPLVARVTT